MAGVFGSKTNPKNKNYKSKGFTSEVLQNYPNNDPAQKNILSGTLRPGESFKPNESQNYGKEFFKNFLEEEERNSSIHKRDNTQEQINKLREEIKALIEVTKDLDKEIENVVLDEISEVSEYQINFLIRIKNLISNFRKNISESCIWMECLNNKKKKKKNGKKKNNFWDNANSSGAKYLTSGEHSASRSAN